MQIAMQNTLKEIAVTLPGSTRVFEKFGLDYCCGGAQTLSAACEKANLAPVALLEALEQVQDLPSVQPDWITLPLGDLVQHLLDTHHIFTRTELARLEKLMDKVRGVHGVRHPELVKAEAVLHSLQQDLSQHLVKEERVLFPYITALDAALAAGKPAPVPMFGTVRNPIRMMSLEHDTAGELLRELRHITNEYALPADACGSFRALYQGLQELEADLHQHIHLENNLLFPRAIALEGGA